MRLHQRSRDDQLNACRRATFDARHSRVKLALDRLADIADEGYRDQEVRAEVAYTEGVIRRDFLGQGFKARKLFERAYNLNADNTDALINGINLAQNKDEFHRLAAIFRGHVRTSERRAHEFLNARCEALDQGISYWVLLHDFAMGQDKAGATGTAVSLLELVLVNHGFSPQEEARKRRWRAQKLRALDEQAEHFRETNREHFPPDERLTLHEALKELDRGIGVDQYDAEMWNLKSAWCRKLERREEALEAAGHAIKIRPYGYAKPHINKAQVLWELGRDSEALACAQEALRQAREAGDAADEQHAQELVEFCRRPRVALDLSNFRFTFERVMRGSNILADIETGEHQAKPEVVTVGFFNRCRKLQGSSSNSYVPIMAELLSDFTPERAFQVVSAIPGMAKQFPMIPNIARVSQEAYDHCLHAALYITAYSEDVRQRDAARFLCMVFFGALEPEKVRMAYRQAILETSAAAVDEMSRLDEIMRAELGRINPNLPRLIADQESVNEEGRKRALRAILSRFTDHGSKPKR